MEDRELRTKLLSLYFLIYGAMACFSPFLAVYMQDRKFSFTQMGIVYAVTSLVSVICQPIWGYITDKHFDKRKTLMITMAGSLIFILLFIVTRDFYLVFTATAIYTLFSSPIWSVADACIYEIIDEKKEIEYGKIRLMGSVGYAITALTLGMLIERFSVNAPFIVGSLLFIPAIFAIRSLKFKDKSKTQILNISDVTKILSNKKFILFIISVMLINICMNVNGNYITVLIQRTGGDVSNLGFLWFVVAISELPILIYGSKLTKRYGIVNIFCISLILYFIRYLLDSICSNYIEVIAVQVMQGITFPVYLIAALEYINELVPPRMRTSGMTLYAALGGGIGAFIGNIGGGIILDRISIFALYRIISVICLIALIIGYLLKSMGKDNNRNITMLRR
jgi:MFS transporter, PPP family, 3-phenylpropionic acid transporter